MIVGDDGLGEKLPSMQVNLSPPCRGNPPLHTGEHFPSMQGRVSPGIVFVGMIILVENRQLPWRWFSGLQ